jgi:high-affinity iron transporter
MTFEQVEREVRAKNPSLATELEAVFAALRTQAASPEAAELTRVRERIAVGLESAERTLSDAVSPANLFVQSFIIMLREGLEAILVVGALMTFLVKMGASDRRRDINLGVGAAVGASLLTAVALETVIHLSPGHREALEGATMVLATVVLFYVSYWLLSKMEVAKWNHFVKSKVHDALTSGSALALASAAFLAVYREGFETVLFYKALFVSGGSAVGAMPVVAGMVAGGVILVGVYVAIHRFGVRLPLKPFFGVTSAFLYYMAFVFAGKGIAELQEGGAGDDHHSPRRAASARARHLSHRGVAGGAGAPDGARAGGAHLDLRAGAPSRAAAQGASGTRGRAGAFPGRSRGAAFAVRPARVDALARANGGRPGGAPRRGRAHAPAHP